MTALEQYVNDGQAEITAYSAAAGEYEKVGAWPSAQFVWDPQARVLAWWWAGDERLHAFKIDQVGEDDYAVTFTHANGKVELGPIWNDEQRKVLDAWRKNPLSENVGEWLRMAVEELVQEPGQAQGLPLRQFQIVAELAPVQDVLGQWAVMGAWAANDEEIAFWALQQYAGVGDWVQGKINEGLGNGLQPLEILDYWWHNANFTTAMRLKRDSVQAASAMAAAEIGARAADREAGGVVTMEAGS